MIAAAEEKLSRATARRQISTPIWLASLFTAVPLVCLAVPMYVIRPFRPQVYSQLSAALTIRSAGPWLSAIAAIIVVGLTLRVWALSKRTLPRVTTLALCILVIAGAALTNVNIFEVMFHPYPSPSFIEPGSASVDSDDKVLAVTINGEARAYPIRTMGYHHIVNDVVGGKPLAVTYCTLCHTGLVWSRILNGTTLHFRLAGINNGNALMRDEETSSIWQQSTGEAIFGPYKGQHLRLIHSDELSFAFWRTEKPTGLVLQPDAHSVAEYDPKDWEKDVEKTRTVVDTTKSGVPPHELVLSVNTPAGSKAYPLKLILASKIVQDQIGNFPVLLTVGPDGTSVRAFKGTTDSSQMTFTSLSEARSIVRDAETGSDWNFEGCAVSGKLAGQCLQALDSNKDYWFDWLNHHPGAQLFRN